MGAFWTPVGGVARWLQRTARCCGHLRPLWWLPVVLLSATACLVPPPEELESENLPPYLEWTATVPLQDQFVFSRNAEGRIEFRIDGAVADPEGDRLDIVWYWVADTGLPTVWYGDSVMTLTPCDLRVLANAQRMSVKVLVSDGELVWTGQADTPLPVTVEEGHTVAKRVWEVTLVGECPI